MSQTTGQAAVDAGRPEGPVVVLVGPPGSGKTTVGEALAARLDVDFRDTDRDIEQSAGVPIADIFVTEGEPQFRALEVLAVERALDEHRGVLALGAGAVLDASTRERLRGRAVVHLQVGLAAAMQRLEMNRSRPLLLGNVRGRWQELAMHREPLYREVEAVAVATDDRSADQVVDAVVAALADLAETRSEHT